MDLLDRDLATKQRQTSKYDEVIRDALRLSKRILNKYYSKTDASEVYRIAMGKFSYLKLSTVPLIAYPTAVLHPRYKLAYFRQQQWEDAWIQAAKDLTHEVYKTSYMALKVSASSALVDVGQEGHDAMDSDDEVRH